MLPCLLCARQGRACCTDRQIVITQGDIARIRAVRQGMDFFVLEPTDPAYVSQDDDPRWITLTEKEPGLRRVLKRKPDGGCFFLTSSGCELPLPSRPLICRMHPYLYTEKELLGIDETCPIAQAPPAQQEGSLLAIGMRRSDIELWRQQIYQELDAEARQSASSRQSTLQGGLPLR